MKIKCNIVPDFYLCRVIDYSRPGFVSADAVTVVPRFQGKRCFLVVVHDIDLNPALPPVVDYTSVELVFGEGKS